MKSTTLLNEKKTCAANAGWRRITTIALMMLLQSVLVPAVQAQQKKLSGKITNDKGEAVSGASIMVKGTTRGTTASDAGVFSLNAANGDILIISSVNYISKEVPVTAASEYNIQLVTGGDNLEQVIVVGYGTQKKKDVTGSVVSVNETALREVPVANLQGALQGRAAGLEIQRTSAKPGAGAVIRIRGERSIRGQNDPLLVLDGIPFEGGNLNDINPDDVSSVEVLKDASATAIYGSRGSNGVLLVTTKRGKAGETRLSYSGYYGITSVRTKYNVFNAQEYQALRNSSTYTGGYLPLEIKGMQNGTSTDWQDEMYQNGYLTNHNLTIMGGGAGGNWSLGGGYFKETTVLPGQDFGRYSLRATIDSKVGKRLKIGLNTMNNITITNGSQFVDPMFPLLTLSPLTTPYDSLGRLIKAPAGNSDDTVTQYNPLLLKNNNNSWVDRITRMRSFNSLYAELQLANGLKYRLNVGLDYRRQESNQFRASDNATAPSYFRARLGNTASVNNIEGYGYTLENILTYDKTIAGKHKINVTGLFSFQEDHTHNTFVSKDSIDENFIQFYNLGQSNASNNVKPVVTGGESAFSLISYMLRVNYAFNDRFLLTLTGRIDGSSRLAKGNNFKTYPAISGGWNISNESFMKPVPQISNMKLRVGYGQTSNQSVDPYSSLGQVSTYNGIGNVGSAGSIIRYNYGPTIVSGYGVTNLPNPTLDWEYTKTVNVGLDFGLFKNRITGTIDWYNANTFKVLYDIVLPPTSGVVGNYLTNIGEMQNKGLEVSLSSTNVSTRSGFTWSTDLNIFFNRNKLVKLTDNFTQNIAAQLFLGQPLTALYDFKKLGIWQINEATEAAKFGALPGDIRLADLSGPNGKPDGVIDANYDRTIIGSGQATWQGGLTNRFSYKGFDLSFVLYARYGGTLVSQIHQPLAGYTALLNGNRNTIKVDYWTPENPTNAFPSPTSMTRTRPVGADINTLGYYDASFIKVRSINLGYEFSGNWVKRIGAQSIRCYVTAQNPFVLYSPYMRAGGVDPEATGTGNQGIQNPGNLTTRALTISASTPPTRTFLLGLNLGF